MQSTSRQCPPSDLPPPKQSLTTSFHPKQVDSPAVLAAKRAAEIAAKYASFKPGGPTQTSAPAAPSPLTQPQLAGVPRPSSLPPGLAPDLAARIAAAKAKVLASSAARGIALVRPFAFFFFPFFFPFLPFFFPLFFLWAQRLLTQHPFVSLLMAPQPGSQTSPRRYPPPPLRWSKHGDPPVPP